MKNQMTTALLPASALQGWVLCLFFLLAAGTAGAQTRLYGVTTGGGPSNSGAIFKIKTDNTGFAAVHHFTGGAGGEHPTGSLALTSFPDRFFGTTVHGGASGFGVLYEFDPNSNTFSVKHDFDDATGKNPQCGMIEIWGELWGTAALGGANGDGVLFRYIPNANYYQVVRDFDTDTDGGVPLGRLLAVNNKVYGMTSIGGANGFGTIFEYDIWTNNFAVLHHFNDYDGRYPRGGLAFKDDVLYGMCDGGNNDFGVIFAYDLVNNYQYVLYHFEGSTGSDPVGDLLVSGDKLFGLTSSGGSGDYGVLFDIDVTTNDFNVRHNFDQPSGAYTDGSLMELSGKLFGVTNAGGVTDDGVIFEFDPATDTYTVMQEMIAGIASRPQFARLSVGPDCPALSIDVTATPPTCQAPLSGSVKINSVYEGAGPYQYSKDGGNTYQNSAIFLNLAPGAYNMLVKDANDCLSDPLMLTVDPLQPDNTAPQVACRDITVTLPQDCEGHTILLDEILDLQTPLFYPFGQNLGNGQCSDVSLGDVDGDGDLDAFMVYLSNQPGEVWFNNGFGLMTNSGQSLLVPGGASQPRNVELGDLDGDGDLDAFVANGHGQNLPNFVWMNNGNGIFTDSGQRLGNANSTSAALGDIDGDGDLDACIGNDGNHNEIWINNGAGVFSNPGQNLGAYRTWGLSLGDLDGDGDLDMFEANYDTQSDRVYWNDGTGNFTDSGQMLGASDSFDADLADLDDDGDLDAFVTNFLQSNDVWINDGAGNFTATGQSFGAGANNAAALGDLDNDGDIDAIVSRTSPNNTFAILLNDGQGFFESNGQNLTNKFHLNAALGDMDGDNDLDALLALYSGTNNLWINGLSQGRGDDCTYFENLNTWLDNPVMYPNMIGQQVVTLTAYDVAGNTSTCTAVVTVNAPSAEICGNGLDDNCNGQIDEDCAEIELLGNNIPIISGDAIPDPADGTDFGSLFVNGQQLTHSFAIQNSGSSDLLISGISLAGAGATQFALQPLSYPITIPANTNTSFDLIFDPSAGGTHVATLSIFNTDGDENPYTFDIQGTGLVCASPLPSGTVYRWTNAGGDGLWNNPNNWLSPTNTTAVPGAGHTAFFACYGLSDAILNVNTTLAKVVMDASYPGVLHLGAQTLTLTQELTVATAGQLDAGTGTVVLGTGSSTITVNCPAALNDLLLNCGTLKLGQHLNVSDNLTLTGISSTNATSNVEIRVAGNVTNNDANGWYKPSGSNTVFVSLVGTADQTLNGAGAYGWLNIAKAGGNVLMNSTVSVAYGLNGTAGANMLNAGGGLKLGISSSSIIVDYAGTVEDVLVNCVGLSLLQHLNIAGDLEVVSASGINSTGGMRLKVMGNVVTQDLNGWTASAFISLNGAADQTVSGPGLIPWLEVNKSGGNVLMPDNLDLQHNGKLSGSGFFDNIGGVFNTKGNASFDFSGTIEDLRCTTNGGSRTITLNQDLQVLNTLTLAGAGAIFRMTASPAGKKLKVAGNVSTEVFSWNTSTNAFISLTGSTDQTITTVGSGSLFKLNVNKPGGNVLMPADIWLYLNGELTGSGLFDNTGGVLRTLSGATFNFNGSIDDLRLAANNAIVTLKQDLQVNNSLTIDATSSGSFTLNANPAGKVLKVNGDVTTSATNWSTGTSNNAYISLRGSADQTLSGTGKIHRFDFAKPAGNALFSTASVKTFSGAATATAGNWDLLGNTFTSSTGGFTASGTGKLTGAGTLTGSVTVASGGGIAPGSPVGCMTITGDLSFQVGATYAVDLNGATTACTDFDQINVSGAVTYNGTLHADFGYTPAMGATYLIANVAGTKTGNFAPLVVVTPNNIACSFAPATGVLTVTGVTPLLPGEDRVEEGAADADTPEMNFRVYPNPAFEMVNLEVTGLAGRPADLMIYDQGGRRVWHHHLYGTPDGEVVRLSAKEAGLPGGVYTLVLRNDSKTITKRFVVTAK